MNLMMHQVDYQNMSLRNADTLESDWPDGAVDGIDRPRSFDAVVANPPYSAKWDNNDNKMKDPRFKNFKKLAPKSKADYAFVLHALYHLNSEGTMPSSCLTGICSVALLKVQSVRASWKTTTWTP